MHDRLFAAIAGLAALLLLLAQLSPGMAAGRRWLAWGAGALVGGGLLWAGLLYVTGLLAP
ncbi:MAG: hypothetical protein EXQ87_09455 [Alphaproteobacteria bacterium]|nr:hypothetical protein [Alphaproteobacteria bacterium]